MLRRAGFILALFLLLALGFLSKTVVLCLHDGEKPHWELLHLTEKPGEEHLKQTFEAKKDAPAVLPSSFTPEASVLLSFKSFNLSVPQNLLNEPVLIKTVRLLI
ncbi:MAG: hypothetical protein GXO03_05760 [Aquificae bacterium]|nr:hypothetical protein [Aquificota bacterium]